MDPPTPDDIGGAIKTLKNGKTPIEEGMCIEMLKAGEPEISCVWDFQKHLGRIEIYTRSLADRTPF